MIRGNATCMWSYFLYTPFMDTLIYIYIYMYVYLYVHTIIICIYTYYTYNYISSMFFMLSYIKCIKCISKYTAWNPTPAPATMPKAMQASGRVRHESNMFGRCQSFIMTTSAFHVFTHSSVGIHWSQVTTMTNMIYNLQKVLHKTHLIVT